MPETPAPTPDGPAPLATAPRTDPRTAELVSHCTYQIATGKWAPEERLPSVRRAGARFGLDLRTVLKAYRQLEAQGLVICRDRSGFYVARASELGRLSRHRVLLAELFERFARQVRAETDLSTVGVFRYFARLAEIRAREVPECAFVECTHAQAEGHAREVEHRLGVPCLPVSLPDLSSGELVVPPEVKTLFVSGFHVTELTAALPERPVEVVPVAIEVAPELFASLPAPVDEALVFETDATEAHDILDDVCRLVGAPALRTRVVGDVERSLATLFASGERSLALLSPRLWGRVDPRWRSHPRVRQIVFRVRAEAWPRIADAIGLPLGAHG